MRDQDKADFAAMLYAVGELYSREVTKPVARIYWQALGHFSIEEVRDALNRHVANTEAGQFFPKPADIIRMLEGGPADVALRAWSAVDRAVRTIGPYQTVAFDDPTTQRVIADMGGWVKLCTRGDDKEWPFVAQEFQKRFRGFAERHETPECPATLTGISEAENASRGLPYREPPRLIGDPTQAKAITQRQEPTGPAISGPKFALTIEGRI